jgi:tetraacyldisaccharide 4'-kinase
MPLSRIYKTIINARNSLYKKGIFKSHSLGAFTVSIGNITVGGTGKTPLVAYVAEVLAENGERVCILTRGYRRENPRQRVLVSDGETILTDFKNAGDEPFELAQKLIGKAIVVADANRMTAGIWARGKFGVTAFVLDDAFQHRRVERDLDIVILDATNPFGNGKTLPTGILREPLENLRRADAIVISRANLVKDISDLKFQVSKYNTDCPIFVSENRISKQIELEKFLSGKAQSPPSATDIEKLATDNCLAFCGLGNPGNFFRQLHDENYKLVAERAFPDHYFYKQSDVETLLEKANQSGARILLTTAKDAVKLKNLKFDLPCFVLESELLFDGEDIFRRWLLKMKNKKPAA